MQWTSPDTITAAASVASHHRTALAALVVCAALGCGDSAPTSSGGMGQLDFAPECGSLNQACLSYGLDAPVAVGADLPLQINYKIAGSSGPPTILRSADESTLTVTNSVVTAKNEGVTAILVVGPSEVALDFIHIWSVYAQELRLLRRNDDGFVLGELGDSAQMFTGDEIGLRAEPYADAQPLNGDLDLEWEVQGEAVVLVHDGIPGWYRAIAVEPGTATVTVRADGLETSVALEVLR